MERPNFLLFGRLSRKRTGMGRTARRISVTMLKAELKYESVRRFMHPLGKVVDQITEIGVQTVVVT
jgi:hypothetical protein